MRIPHPFASLIRATEYTEGVFLFPNRKTAIGKNPQALRSEWSVMGALDWGILGQDEAGFAQNLNISTALLLESKGYTFSLCSPRLR